MPPKQSTVAEDLIIALSDKRVLDAIAGVIQDKLKPLIQSITELKEDNAKKATQIVNLQTDLKSANSRIEALESYNRRDNLLISGLPVESFAEAASTATAPEELDTPSQSVEQSVLKLFNNQLGVPIKPADISIAHRLGKRNNRDPGPPVTIVRFATRKAREAVYAARRQLKTCTTARIFINEDLTKNTAAIFHQARQLVRRNVIHSAWTSKCSVFIKETSDPNCRPRKVAVLSDLPATPTSHD